MVSDRALIGAAFFVGVFILWTSSSSLSTMNHENAHYQSCLYFGGNGTIKYNPFALGGQVECVGIPQEKEQLWNQTAALQEAIGYPFNQVINSVYAAAAIIVAAIFVGGKT